MTTDSMKITVPDGSDRDGIKTLAGWKEVFSESELVEIIHRYCNTQDSAKKYRQSAAEKSKALAVWLKAQGGLDALKAKLNDTDEQ